MTHRSKIAIASAVLQTAIFIPMYLSVNQSVLQTESLHEQFPLWGAFFLKLLAISVISMMVITLFIQLYLTLRYKESVFTVTDERDRMIEAKAVRNFCYVFCFGFFSATLTAALNVPALWFFRILAVSFIAAGITLYLSYVFHYERGY